MGFDIQNDIRDQVIGNLSDNQFNLLGDVTNFIVMNLNSQSGSSAETVINGMRNNQVLNNAPTLGIILSASSKSSIHINIDVTPGTEVPLDVLSWVNNDIPVQDTKSGGTVMVTEIVN
jgi:hypothetical protein